MSTPTPPAIMVPGVFNCTIPNQKSSYCPGDVINWVVTASKASFSDPLGLGAALIDCHVSSPVQRPAVQRPTNPGPCFPALTGANLQTFINDGGKGAFTVPGDYAGFSQYLDPFVYYARNAGSNRLELNTARCPEFFVAKDCPTTGTTATTATDSATATATDTDTDTDTTSSYPTSTGTEVATSTSLNSAIAHSASAAFVVALVMVL